MFSLVSQKLKGSQGRALSARVHAVNEVLAKAIYFSTQKPSNYDKMMSGKEFRKTRSWKPFFDDHFLSHAWFSEFAGLGFAEINPKVMCCLSLPG